MSVTKVTILNFFSGWLVAGMDPREWDELPKLEQIKARMDYLAEGAQCLAEMPHDPDTGIPANVHRHASMLLHAARAALAAIKNERLPEAMSAAFDAGVQMEKVGSVQITMVALHKLQAEFSRRSKGGENTANKKKAAGQLTREAIVDEFHAEQKKTGRKKKTDREIPGAIARKLDLDPSTVRKHLKEAGLR